MRKPEKIIAILTVVFVLIASTALILYYRVTAFEYALEYSDVEALDRILTKKPHLINREGDFGTPLQIAIGKSSRPVVKLLIEKGANVNSSMHDAVCNYRVDTELMQMLLNAGADPNATDFKGRTPLHWAARECKLNAVPVLLDAGADINARSSRQRTPLHLAISVLSRGRIKRDVQKEAEVVAALIEAGAQIDAADDEGQRALHRAAMFGALDAARILIEKGADINAKDARGRTPLKIAVQEKQTALVDLLSQNGAKE